MTEGLLNGSHFFLVGSDVGVNVDFLGAAVDDEVSFFTRCDEKDPDLGGTGFLSIRTLRERKKKLSFIPPKNL